MLTSPIVMEFSPSTSIRRLSVVLYVIALVYLSFCDAVSQNGARPGTCIGFGGFDDSCPIGMYCDNNIGGTCLNCSKCYESSFFVKLIPYKCQCDSSVTGSSAICESIPASDLFGRPVESEEDVNRLVPNNSINDFKGYFDGTRVRGLPCADLTTSSSQPTPYGLLTPYLSTPPVQDNPVDDSSTETGHSEQCMDPGNPVNGYKNHANYTKGGRIEFACNKSYSLQGKKLIQCMEGGKWSDEIPTCNKDKMMPFPLVLSLLFFVVFMLVLLVVVIGCYRHKVRSGSISCTPSNCSDAENPPVDERSFDDVNSEKYSMLPESSESNSEEPAGSSSGTGSCSSTPEHTSAVYLTDEESTHDPLASSSIQQSMRMDSVCLSSISSCSEKLTELAWSAMQSSLQTLLEDREFRRVFLKQLFLGIHISDDMLNNVYSLTDEYSVKGVREQAEIFDVDSFGTMGRILTDSSLRRNYPAKGENMDKLVQSLNGAHKSCDKCNGASQLPSDYSTAV